MKFVFDIANGAGKVVLGHDGERAVIALHAKTMEGVKGLVSPYLLPLFSFFFFLYFPCLFLAYLPQLFVCTMSVSDMLRMAFVSDLSSIPLVYTISVSDLLSIPFVFTMSVFDPLCLYTLGRFLT